jgi:transcriptional/translational regulatory protein YebC/TACO1
VALLVEAATDNPTRTVASVRNIVTKNGGNLATSGSVGFLFKHMGVFRLDPAGIDQDDLELYLIDHGLEEMGESRADRPDTTSGPGALPPGTLSNTGPNEGRPQLVIRCAFADFGKLQEALEARGITPLSAEHEYVCTVPTELPEEQATEVLALIDKLEQDEDVQRVFHTLA